MAKLAVIRTVTGVMYRKCVKPLLFLSPPDKVHSDTIAAGLFFQRSALVRRLIRVCWAYPSTPALRQQLNGISYPNPVGLSAGFDKNVEVVPLMKSIGFGFMEAGTVTHQVSHGNPRPWFHRLPKSQSLAVHSGLANHGMAVIAKRIATYSAATFDQFTLNLSVAHSNVSSVRTERAAIDDCMSGVLAAAKLESVGMITINISCPNTYDGAPFTNPAALEKLLKKLDAAKISQPVFLKMPVSLGWDEFDAILQVAAAHSVSGVTIANLAKSRQQIIQAGDNLPDNVKGGFSGGPTAALSNDLIARTRRKYKTRFTIIGVGGIFTADDAYTKIRLGANLVALITGLIYVGPQLVGQINQGLDERLQRDGFASIADAVGIDIDDAV